MNTRVRDLRWRDVRLHLVQRFLGARLGRLVHDDGDLVRLGSELCGWWVPAGLVRPGAVAYCAGAGWDITFDLELLARGCRVTTFDPTPHAIDYVESLGVSDPGFRFVPVGWWDAVAQLRFYIPDRPVLNLDHNPNLSAVNLSGSSAYVTAPVRPVRDLMVELGDTHIDIMKLDIEGAEYHVLGDVLTAGPLPSVLCVEFDQPQPPRKTIDMVRRIVTAGYQLRRIEFLNYTFVHSAAALPAVAHESITASA